MHLVLVAKLVPSTVTRVTLEIGTALGLKLFVLFPFDTSSLALDMFKDGVVTNV